MNKFFTLLLSSLLLLSCSSSKSDNNDNKKVAPKQPRNVILLIGDGMGINQVYAAMSASPEKLAFEQFTATAFVKTYSANRYITDSAAGGTAIACGTKTDNGMLGLSPDSVALTSILELYKAQGYATGLVVTSAITHATPAAFYAHIASRGESEAIATQLYQADVDFFCGGGRQFFEARTDSVSLTDSLNEKGYNIYYRLDSLRAPLLLPCGILAADNDLPAATERGTYLPTATDLAIKSLKAKAGEKGFFLMVEGSQIDYRCHGNDAEGLIPELLDFEQAIAAALAFAQADGNTLVVVTADHETGGVTIVDGTLTSDSVEVSFGQTGQAGTSVGHTGTMVPLFAFGPGSALFRGIIDNTQISKLILQGDDIE